MEETVNLYMIKTRGFRAYVVGRNTQAAISRFRQYLDEADYGYYWERDFQSIELVASNISRPKTATGNAFDDARKDDLLLVTI